VRQDKHPVRFVLVRLERLIIGTTSKRFSPYESGQRNELSLVDLKGLSWLALALGQQGHRTKPLFSMTAQFVY
jgi:hypothetical protein